MLREYRLERAMEILVTVCELLISRLVRATIPSDAAFIICGNISTCVHASWNKYEKIVILFTADDLLCSAELFGNRENLSS